MSSSIMSGKRPSTLWLLLSTSLICAACQRSGGGAPDGEDVVLSTPRTTPKTTPREDKDMTNDNAPEKADAEPPEHTPEVKADHYIFVGKPEHFAKLDCELFDSPQAPHRAPSRADLHDATDYPQRHTVSISILDVIRGTGPVGAPVLGTDDSSQGTSHVAFALGLDAFREGSDKGTHGDYDSTWCKRINAILESPYVVIHAYKVYVDRGNSAPDPFQETWGSLGTDPLKANRGFDTREEAFAYAKSLVEVAPK